MGMTSKQSSRKVVVVGLHDNKQIFAQTAITATSEIQMSEQSNTHGIKKMNVHFSENYSKLSFGYIYFALVGISSALTLQYCALG